MANPTNARATVGLVCIDILAFFSTSFWRNKYYNVFLVSHVIAVVGLLASVRPLSPFANKFHVSL